MAWNIGANDVANAMGTSVGSRALTFRQAVILAGIFEFAGAVLVGSHVTDTVRKGIVNPMAFVDEPQLLIYGMLAALIASALWLHLASHLGQPVSTTHSIVGSIFGFGLITGGAVKWATMGSIVASWIISPLVSGLIGFFLFMFVRKMIFSSRRPNAAAARIAPYFITLVVAILCLSLIYKGLKNLHLNLPLPTALLVSISIGAVVGVAAYFHFTHRRGEASTLKDHMDAEHIFKYLQVTTACYIAFAHGANDVANAVGPLAAIHSVYTTGEVSMKVQMPMWILLIGGGGIVLGLAMFGRRVMETIGKKITDMTPSRGFSAEFSAATTVLVCSKIGLPVSTTHALVGAVIGVGLARGLAALQMQTVKKIYGSWLATIPATAGLTILFFLLAKWFLIP
ncbi:MAG: inorganic phosphate transporter [Candidatus Eisenbacteria bacterium]|uniref:Phosphate transporter n=1 Tax=Eiseniibacteriota bacterium TaxID=2212470 RepID=A0A948WEU9_UNCEI|nr:inorganic phosphate transporter [Candidatus Eisenbacteria bacterium]MBU1948306.1 inorganic phosphate transporter [Candidatus Eisenbacteria bacterium]MBU2693098.1 inorganic phosphate transporter [Candidatus Eisenbacteria bacterium]